MTSTPDLVTNSASASAVNPAGATVAPVRDCPTATVTVDATSFTAEPELGEVDDLHRLHGGWAGDPLHLCRDQHRDDLTYFESCHRRHDPGRAQTSM